MVRGKGPQQAVDTLSKTEIETLRDEQQELKSTIREASDADRAIGVDISALQKRSDHIDRQIDLKTPQEARGKEKDKLYNEEKNIEDFLVRGMPTRYEMDHPARCPGAVRKHMKWTNDTKEAVSRYVQIQRILRPEEPKSVEALRKDK